MDVSRSKYDFFGATPPFDTTIDSTIGGQCRSTVSSGQKITFATLLTGSTTWDIVTSSMTVTSHINGIPVNGWNFAAQSVPPQTSASSTTQPSQTSPSTASATETSTGSAGPSDAPQSHSNSQRNFEIGVSVAVGVVALAVLAALSWYFLRRARKEETKPRLRPLFWQLARWITTLPTNRI